MLAWRAQDAESELLITRERLAAAKALAAAADEEPEVWDNALEHLDDEGAQGGLHDVDEWEVVSYKNKKKKGRRVGGMA